MRGRTCFIGMLAFIGVACAGGAEQVTVPPTEPPARGDEGMVRATTPEGEAVIELVVEPTEITLGGTVTVRLMNRGLLPVMTGLHYSVERWDGQGWVEVPWPENSAFPSIGIILAPGQSTEPQRWPWEMQPEPGWHRTIKSAWYEDPNHRLPDIPLVASARFLIRD